MDLYTLDREEILQIYETLVRDFAKAGDPITPTGIRDDHLLESAVSRQHVGAAGILKHPQPISNAATLAYGLCNNHPFFNGNKRTALVSILVHLDKNKLCLWGTNQNELYEYILAVANHQIPEWVVKQLGGIVKQPQPDESASDLEVRMMATWLSRYAAWLRRGEESIRYRDLRKILRRFGFDLKYPAKSFIHVVCYRPDGSTQNIDTVFYPGDSRPVEVNVIKRVRERCRLTEEDGIDSDVFYGKYGVLVDEFINRYRLVLRRLSDV